MSNYKSVLQQFPRSEVLWENSPMMFSPEGIPGRIKEIENGHTLPHGKYIFIIEFGENNQREEHYVGENVDDATFEHLLSIAPDLSANLVEQNDMLKEYILKLRVGESQEKSKIIDVSFQLYAERIFSMRDVLKFTNLKVDEFYAILNKKGIPFQYEDDFSVKEEDIEDWL